MQRLCLGSLVGLLVFVMAVPALAETMYAKKNTVKVTVEKSPLSKVVATLNRGDSVHVLSKRGKHYKVKVRSGKVGWVFKFKLSTHKPATGGGRGSLSALTGESSVAAREARSGGSIRGLKETSKAYAEHKQIDPAHGESVDRMTGYTVSDEELMKFQQQGAVGEFAGGGL